MYIVQVGSRVALFITHFICGGSARGNFFGAVERENVCEQFFTHYAVSCCCCCPLVVRRVRSLLALFMSFCFLRFPLSLIFSRGFLFFFFSLYIVQCEERTRTSRARFGFVIFLGALFFILYSCFVYGSAGLHARALICSCSSMNFKL